MRLGSRLLQLPVFGALLLVAVVACSSDDEATPPAAKCGNGKIEGTEVCDGAQLGGKTCSTASGGTKTGTGLKCSATCTFDQSACTAVGTGGTTGGTGGVTTGGTGGVGTGGSGTGGSNAGGIGGESPSAGGAGQAGAP